MFPNRSLTEVNPGMNYCLDSPLQEESPSLKRVILSSHKAASGVLCMQWIIIMTLTSKDVFI